MCSRAVNRRWASIAMLTGLALVIATASASAQTTGGIGGGGIGGGGIGGGGIGGGGIGGGGIGGSGASGGGFAGASGSGALGFAGGASGMSGATGGALGFAGSNTTGTGRTGAGVSGSTTGTGVQPTNPFVATYSNPYAMGYPSSTGRSIRFGQPVYTTTTTTGAVGGGTLSSAPGGLVFATTYPTRRAPEFITALSPDFEYTRPAPKAVEARLQGVIDRSSALRTKGAIRVTVVGEVALLQGRVNDAKARRLAEALVRLTPGVRGVQNQLAIIKP